MRQTFLQAGKITAPHGVRGDVKVEPWSDGPEFLRGFSRVRVDGKEYAVEKSRSHKSCTLLKLKGVDSMDAARMLRDKVVEVFREDAPAGAVYVCELIGMDVYHGQTCIGQVEDVLDYPGNMVYVVRGACTYQIPAVKEFVLGLDVEANRMDVKLIEGMRTDED